MMIKNKITLVHRRYGERKQSTSFSERMNLSWERVIAEVLDKRTRQPCSLIRLDEKLVMKGRKLEKLCSRM